MSENDTIKSEVKLEKCKLVTNNDGDDYNIEVSRYGKQMKIACVQDRSIQCVVSCGACSIEIHNLRLLCCGKLFTVVPNYSEIRRDDRNGHHNGNGASSHSHHRDDREFRRDNDRRRNNGGQVPQLPSSH